MHTQEITDEYYRLLWYNTQLTTKGKLVIEKLNNNHAYCGQPLSMEHLRQRKAEYCVSHNTMKHEYMYLLVNKAPFLKFCQMW